MTQVPETHRDILKDEKKAFAFLATVMKDGTPQVTPVWFDTAGSHFRINTARGRVKERNLRRNPKVAFAIADPDDPYRYIQVRGKIVDVTEEGAVEHIHKLSHKYRGRDYTLKEGMVRVIFVIEPESISVYG